MKKCYFKGSLLLSLLSVSAFASLNGEPKKEMVTSFKNATKTVQVMVRVKEGVNTQGAYSNLVSSNAILSDHIQMVKSFPLVGQKQIGTNSVGQKNMLVLKSNTLTEEELLNQAKKINGAELVEVDRMVYPSTTPNDTRYPELWGMHNDGTHGQVDTDIDAPEAWKMHRGSKNVVVGVIDTGVDYRHKDLVNNMWVNPNEIAGNGIDDDNNGYIDDMHGINAILDIGDPMDTGGHGTHVAGAIGAEGNNSLGVTGVNWTASIAACRFLGFDGGSTSDGIQCINYFTDLKVNRGVNVVLTNNSWGGGSYSQLVKDAISTAGTYGILFVAAAGNEDYNNDVNLTYPASYDADNIISVAAIDTNDERANFSNYGVTTVDLAAPGVKILSTISNKGFPLCTPNENEVFYKEGFENNLSNWILFTSDRTNQEVDLPNEHFKLDMNDSSSGNASLTETLANTYNNNRIQRAVLKDNIIDLSSVPSNETVCASFSVKGETENQFDVFDLFVSYNGGDSWEHASRATGLYEDWTKISVELPAKYFVNNFNMALLRQSDDGIVYGGYNIDELTISSGEKMVSNSYQSFQGTSMAAPYVAGAVALLAAAHPDLNSSELKSTVLNTVDIIPALEDVVATGGRLNIHKMLESKKGVKSKIKHDLNGDGYSDILIKNEDNFRLNGWFGLSNEEVSSQFLKTLSAEREIVKQGDINGDGYLDLLVYNSNTHALAILKGSASGMVENVYLKRLSEEQMVIDMADVNGDGYDDILIKNINNSRVNALLGSMNTTVTTKYLKTLAANQVFKGVMDVNGDGFDDIIVQNSENRRVNAWLSDMNANVQNKYLKTLSSTVEIMEAIDFNADGYDDIIVKNSDNGRINAWLSDANANMSNHYIKTLSSDLMIEGMTDINGDKFPDIIVHNTNNDRVSAWINNAGQTVNTQYLQTLSGSAKLMIHEYDINGDGYDDILVENLNKRVSAWLGSSNGSVTNKYLKTLADTQEIITP
ncbi:MAG: Serine protease, subtilase family [uncultured Sulfurovum sp.]|uniref:Serine protease, subtilase family n=1 Tax=uncultured Sulfurovum sp. TaxID=269237 RepID=A0A6S6TS20_9BACT|nr:MAG: Serine protease, subtilase family [uncultured Sulfurovum sp.]